VDPGRGHDGDALRRTELARLRSLREADLVAASSLHAGDYQLITPNGDAWGKEHYLGLIASGEFRYELFEPVSDLACWGDGRVGLVRYVARIRVAGGTDFTCWHTDSYEVRDQRWQAVWSQATVIGGSLR
jgi:hypothetical protein